MNATCHYQVRDDVAVLSMDHPPLNALSRSLRQSILDRCAEAEADARVKAIVLTGIGRAFAAGADIREFGRPIEAPDLGDVYIAVEACTKPVVAAINGLALGGGLEAALACHWRVAAPNVTLGLPEITLGILPGAGGTQRLPRLVGSERAMAMITSGKPILADEARTIGLVDAVAEGDVVDAAIAFARDRVAEGVKPRRSGDLTAAPAEAAKIEKLRAAKSRAPFAHQRCIDAVEAASQLAIGPGLVREAELFQACADRPEHGALVHVFFSERAAGKPAQIPDDASALPIRNAAVIGSGTMGGGIAMCFANAGIPVTLIDVSEQAVQAGLDKIIANYSRSRERGSLSKAAVDGALNLITISSDLSAISSVDIVIEAVFEEMPIKKQVFAQIDRLARRGAVLATNTSTLDIDEIASATSRPRDVVGTHFFSPANVMKLLENVTGAQTAPDVLKTVMNLGKRLGKVPVLAGNCDGFIGNRILDGYLREALFLLEEGATAAQVDGALERFGLAMGPLRMSDLAGLDVGWRIRKGKAHLRPADLRYSAVADELCELGHYGQKTGHGFYRYEGRNALESQLAAEVIQRQSAAQGIEQRSISEQEIIERCLFALVNEGANVLADGTAGLSSDIDIVYVHGYGFPAWRGGPMYWAEHDVGLSNVLASIQNYERIHGAHWRPAPLLVDLVGRDAGWDAAEALPSVRRTA